MSYLTKFVSVPKQICPGSSLDERVYADESENEIKTLPDVKEGTTTISNDDKYSLLRAINNKKYYAIFTIQGVDNLFHCIAKAIIPSYQEGKNREIIVSKIRNDLFKAADETQSDKYGIRSSIIRRIRKGLVVNSSPSSKTPELFSTVYCIRVVVISYGGSKIFIPNNNDTYTCTIAFFFDGDNMAVISEKRYDGHITLFQESQDSIDLLFESFESVH